MPNGRDGGDRSVFVHGVGHFHPENVIDNSFLSSLEIGSDEQWILDRVGIKSRRTVLPLEYIATTKNASPDQASSVSMYSNAETGAKAARLALERARLKPSDVGLVIAGGCSPQYSIPPEACRIAAELGIDAPAYDLNSACSSFAAQVHHVRATCGDCLPDYVLIVNVENTTRTVDYRDRRTAVLWGDGSAAAVVSRRISSGVRIKHSVVGSDPKGWKKVVIPAGGHFSQDGTAVQGFAIRRSLAIITALREHASSGPSEMYFIGHQANLRMLNAVCRQGGIPEARHLYNVDACGNCAAAGAPTVLSERWDDLRTESEIAMVVVGSGLSWGGLLFQIGGDADCIVN